jgi:hypothetical protein
MEIPTAGRLSLIRTWKYSQRERIEQIVDRLRSAYDFRYFGSRTFTLTHCLPLIQKADLITLIVSTDQSSFN